MGAVASRFQSAPWAPSKIISVNNGQIQGRKYEIGEKAVEAFLGIPFAKPPVEELRFLKPQAAESWTEVRSCTEFGHRCPHEELWMEKLNRGIAAKGEDCLHLNVFAPTWTPDSVGLTKGFPVLFFIHGGGFCVHSSSHYGDHGICETLCTKDVIVVTTNYRLGFFGFSAGDDIPSNVGLWDQTMALQWVQDNIKHFNGDASNVTIFGQSAGGASVDFLTLSPYSRNLFKKAIPMGGTALCSFNFNDKKHVKQVCLEYATKLGYKPEEHASPAAFLRTVSAHTLETGIFGSNKVNRNGKIDLTPVFDGEFFPKPFDELRNEAPKKIIMTGITEHEGLLFVGLRPPRANIQHEVTKIFEREMVHCKSKDVERIKKEIMDMYMQNVNPSSKKEMNRVAVKMVSDAFINNGAWDYADRMTNLGHTVYQYCFEYFNHNGFGLLGFVMPFKAATHGSELPFIFKKGVISKFSPNEDDLKVVEVFTNYFANFAKYDNPNGKEDDPQLWKPLQPGDTLKYLSINLDKVRMCDNFCDGRPVLWRNVYSSETQQNGVNQVEEAVAEKNLPLGKL